MDTVEQFLIQFIIVNMGFQFWIYRLLPILGIPVVNQLLQYIGQLWLNRQNSFRPLNFTRQTVKMLNGNQTL